MPATQTALLPEVIDSIQKSRKYHSIYPKTIERISRDCLNKFGAQRAEKEAKNLLHQIWGAFYSSRPDFNKLENQIRANRESGKSIQESIAPVLKIHSSLRERIPIITDFYRTIFEVTGLPQTIIDHACGLNPLSFLLIESLSPVGIKAYDIDRDQISFLNSVFDFLKVNNIRAYEGDLLVDEFEYADIIFMLKLLPCLEHQKKNSGITLIKKQKCKYVVVSFPVRSLSGSKKGMADFYSNKFKQLLEKEQMEFKEILFETELVFVIIRT